MSKLKNFSKLKWEILEEVMTGALEENDFYRKKLRRTKVAGGWLVESEVYDQSGGFGVGLTFVADAEHAWEMAKELSLKEQQ